MAITRPAAPAAALFGARGAVCADALASLCMVSAAERAFAEAEVRRIRAAYGMGFCAAVN